MISNAAAAVLFPHWVRDKAKDIATYKDVNENVMHSSMQITETIYSHLKENKLKSQIDNLGKGEKSLMDMDNEKIISALEMALNKLRKI
jgi:phenolic acid decarboxylase